MSTVHDPPPYARILQLATASWLSAAVSAAASLGVADELAGGPRPVDELATALDVHPDALYRLLRTCSDAGLFREGEGRRFALTDAGHALRSDGPGSMRDFAIWTGSPADRWTWSALTESVRTGRSAFESVHGAPIWDWFRDHPDAAEIFDAAMTSTSNQVIAPVVAAYDFGGFERIVDVGGGRGALLAAILAANPDARGVLYDQPGVVSPDRLQEAGVAHRSETVAGSFFDSVPSGGDAYVLSNIIHDWDDERSQHILRNCRDVMKPDGRVLLVEAVMPDGPGPAPTVNLMDLDMLLLCDGRQRTEAQFAALFEAVGLELVRVVPSGLCSVVEARPV
ncbi:methyltransferase [Pseudonocardia endophytica]|uniref:O-methyltransferase n=1 Tax=Pseudonocardia endophytica TaxID=401976 RepID=A0A4R1HM36_PSEEN|nr:methyltransferase [Pseudonocardia endophytica]TCK22093.1 O-methyltransferase [Pseudonocardia endophytica]